MSSLRVVIYVVLAALAGWRLWRLWRRNRARRTDVDAGGSAPTGDRPQTRPPVAPTRTAGRRPTGPGLLGDVGLVAGREVRERLRGRTLRVGTLVVLAVVGAAIVIPVLTKSPTGPTRVGLVGPSSAALRAAIVDTGNKVGARVQLSSIPDGVAARTDLRQGRLDLAVVDGRSVEVKKALSASDTSTTAELARAVALTLGVDVALASAGLTPAQLRQVSGAKPLPVTGLEAPSPTSTPGRTTSLIGVIIVFIMLSQYCTWTLIGVMEEKSSRVVEVLLSAVRPIQLLAGKVLGIATVALGQASMTVAFALVLADAVGSDLLKGSAPVEVAAALVWLVLGYTFYCWVYAAAGSLAERQDQVQSLVLPLSLPMIAGYVLSITAASSGHASPFFEVLAYLPPTAPFAMPVLVGLGVATWWEFALSVVVSLAATVGMARLAAGVYARAILRTGRRVRLREILGAAGAAS